jgi:hypothetical protein
MHGGEPILVSLFPQSESIAFVLIGYVKEKYGVVQTQPFGLMSEVVSCHGKWRFPGLRRRYFMHKSGNLKKEDSTTGISRRYRFKRIHL